MTVEETVRATIIILEARGMMNWPDPELTETIIGDVMEMMGNNDEENYDEGQPDWHQEWHDFDPEA